MDLTEVMAGDAAKRIVVPTDEALKTVGDLANAQYLLETRLDDDVISELESSFPSIPELEAALKKRKEELAKIKEVELPNAIEAFGLSEVKLLDGSLVSIKEEVYAGITEEHREPAYTWLEKTGNDGIIKNEVKLPFGKGQDAEAKQVIDLLTDRGFSFTNSRSVHPQTLKAFVKKQLEAGNPIPTDIFSIHVKKVASIKKK